MLADFHSLKCIIPPYMLKSMHANGSASQKKLALAAIAASARWRGQRQALSEVAAFATAVPVAAAGKHRAVYTAEHASRLPGRLVLEEGGPPPRGTPP